MSATKQHIALPMEDMHRNGASSNVSSESGVGDVVDSRFDRVPRAVPEIDDDEYDDRAVVTGQTEGVDDSFLPANGGEGGVNNGGGGGGGRRNGTGIVPHGDVPRRRRPSFGFPNTQDEDPNFVEINGVMTPVPDVNAYQHKKTLAQGMMDLALLSANANQLRYVLETYRNHPYYWPSLIFISISIIFQVAVGVGLIINGRYNITNKREACRANRINNYTIIGIFIVTVVNVFISAFGVADPVNS